MLAMVFIHLTFEHHHGIRKKNGVCLLRFKSASLTSTRTYVFRRKIHNKGHIREPSTRVVLLKWQALRIV